MAGRWPLAGAAESESHNHLQTVSLITLLGFALSTFLW
jgi:hypothetical protein